MKIDTSNTSPHNKTTIKICVFGVGLLEIKEKAQGGFDQVL